MESHYGKSQHSSVQLELRCQTALIGSVGECYRFFRQSMSQEPNDPKLKFLQVGIVRGGCPLGTADNRYSAFRYSTAGRLYFPEILKLKLA